MNTSSATESEVAEDGGDPSDRMPFAVITPAVPRKQVPNIACCMNTSSATESEVREDSGDPSDPMPFAVITPAVPRSDASELLVARGAPRRGSSELQAIM